MVSVRTLNTGLLLLILLGALSFPCSTQATSLTIAHYLDYKPYAYVDQNGRSMGMLVDMWRLWAEKSEVQLNFVPARLGGSLFIGVADDAALLGLDPDYRSFQKRPNGRVLHPCQRGLRTAESQRVT